MLSGLPAPASYKKKNRLQGWLEKGKNKRLAERKPSGKGWRWTQTGEPSPDCSTTSGSDGKELACNSGDPSSTPGLGRSPGVGNGNPSSIFAWRIPWTEEPGRLQSMGSQRVRYNLATKPAPD